MIPLHVIFVLQLWLALVPQSWSDDQLILPAETVPPSRSIRSIPDTSNFIFASVAGLLKVWSNAIFPHGHSIVPGVVPRGTRLYHGVNNGDPAPNRTEWLAFEPYYSYVVHAMMSGPVELLTYAAIRPLRVIYFDGQSAALGTAGPMDSQAALINGSVSRDLPLGNPVRGDYARADKLCNIGQKLGFEGIIRMHTGFELILCDFQDGIELVGRINVSDRFKQLDSSKEETPFYARGRWEHVRSTIPLYQMGEARVKLDLTGFVSFYDRLGSLSQIPSKRPVDRAHHRLAGISQPDSDTVLKRLRASLDRTKGPGSQKDAIDWSAVIRNIVDHYQIRLQELEVVLSGNLTTIPREVRRVTYAMLMPYLDMTRASYVSSGRDVERCVGGFTDGRALKLEQLTESELVILGSVEGTLERICATSINIFEEAFGLSLIDNDQTMIQKKVELWRDQLDGLVSWLGWPKEPDCLEKCAPDELCMAALWPLTVIVTGKALPRCVRAEEVDWKKSVNPGY